MISWLNSTAINAISAVLNDISRSERLNNCPASVCFFRPISDDIVGKKT
jgi:hypothetical protein